MPDLMAAFEDQVRRLIAARYSLVFVETHEEERLERILGRMAQKTFSEAVPLFTWSVTGGLKNGAETLPDTQDPVAALNEVIAFGRPALFLFYDLDQEYARRSDVLRRLRDTYRALRATYKTVFICGPRLDVPLGSQKEVAVLDLPLPGLAEIDRLFGEVCASQKDLKVELGEQRDAILRGALGLTEQEARAAFTKTLLGRKVVGPDILEKIYEEKRTIVRQEGILDYVPPRVSLEQIGGLSHLKTWLNQRRRFFSREAEDFGLDPPKGLLVTGISGCGKSVCIQAISSFWSMPLLRLDMNRIYAGISGSPERTLERAIRTAEGVSPCVLWIDEIETALVGTGGAGGGPATRIFSSFLTWMQEKQHMVFVAATANEIDKLPPELLRKGRFDEVFFVDLPNEAERLEIFKVHLRKRNQDPDKFDLISMAKATNNFNGAEIEQIVLSALYTAFDAGRTLETTDLYRGLGRMIPLATTMSERIKEIKRWADQRAVRANG